MRRANSRVRAGPPSFLSIFTSTIKIHIYIMQGTGRPLKAGAFNEIPEGVFSRATAAYVRGASLKLCF